MTTRPIVPSEVWINEKQLHVKLSPYICTFGLWLHNKSGGGGGPHTEIAIPPTQLASILEAATNEPVTVEFCSPDLGKIDECSGYAAADVGPHTRKIIALKLTVHREERSTVFHFEGSTGLIEPTSVHSASQVHRQSHETYAFSIRFTIDDKTLSEHLGDKAAIDAMSSFLSMHPDESAC